MKSFQARALITKRKPDDILIASPKKKNHRSQIYNAKISETIKQAINRLWVTACKKVLRMLSQEQSSSEPRPEASGCNNGTDAAAAAAAFRSGEGSEEFLSTGRTGRRNAMPDILGQHAETATGDLPQKLEALTTGWYNTLFFFSFSFHLENFVSRKILEAVKRH